MFDLAAQNQFSRGCVRASCGYAAASVAAYTDAASRVLDFWSTALEGLGEPSVDADVPPNKARAADQAEPEPPFGFAMQDWCLPWLDPQRYERMARAAQPASPLCWWLGVANWVPLRGAATAWPAAHLMIESGVPRSVAWPAAEANAAAIDAADAATRGLRKVLATYQTGDGFASVPRSLAVFGLLPLSLASLPGFSAFS